MRVIAAAPMRAAFATNAESLAAIAPSIAARGGIIGRTYGASFEPEAEKNARVVAAKIRTNFRGLNCGAKRSSLQAGRQARSSAPIHGSAPMTTSGMKYHQGPTRWWTFVRKRVTCS